MIKKIWIVTLFPEIISPIFKFGVLSKLFDKGSFFQVNFVNPREYVPFKYKAIDDSPYGGGPGMVIRPDILKAALEQGIFIKYQLNDEQSIKDKFITIYTSPRGARWNDLSAKQFAQNKLLNNDRDLIFICGRYEGLDERFIQKYVDLEISVGDYILTGGEIAVMAILDSSLRFLPNCLGNRESAWQESFSHGLLEGAVYTRPQNFEGIEVPEILLSGNHKKIAEYKNNESLRLTKLHRPDLLEKH